MLVFCAIMVFGQVQAKDLKIGLVLPMSGTFAVYGEEITHGIDIYLAEHGDEVAGREVKLIVTDTGGINPAVAKRNTLNLLVKDKVDILAGYAFTPNAFSAASLATQAKVPMIVLNAATSSITQKSPYIVRVSMTMAQNSAPMAKWAYNNGIRSVYTLVADYGPGHGAEKAFQKTFSELGGEIIGEVRVPVNTIDYAPYLRRIEDAKPDAIFTFVPNGQPAIALAKSYRMLGLEKSGIKMLATGDVTDDATLHAMGSAALGWITSHHYSVVHKSTKNKAFIESYNKLFPEDRPNFQAVAGYDGMHLIYKALKQTSGNADADAFIDAAEGMEWVSPRGPVKIDPETRDIVQNVYIREVERVDGVLRNVEFYTFEQVEDPLKQ